MKTRLAVTIAVGVLFALLGAGSALAQGVPPANPPALAGQATATPVPGKAKPTDLLGIGKQRWNVFDAVAKAVNLTPGQLFEQVHGGKSLEQIAQAQGVDTQVVKNAAAEAARAGRIETAKQALERAETSGRITKDQASWLRQGLDKGWLPKMGVANGGADRSGLRQRAARTLQGLKRLQSLRQAAPKR